jgi:hypothetical protein
MLMKILLGQTEVVKDETKECFLTVLKKLVIVKFSRLTVLKKLVKIMKHVKMIKLVSLRSVSGSLGNKSQA